MNMSTMPTIFESAEQSSEYSDELMTALAAGRWWAIMEVSDPISDEPEEYGDLISGQCWGTEEAGRTSCPTSLVFSDASEKAQSQNSDTTLKTTKHWRQKMTQGAPFSSRSTQGAPVPARSKQGASVPASSEKGGLTSSMAFSDSSEKAQHSGFSDTTMKTTDQRRKWRQKKPQGAPVPAESRQEPHVHIGSQKRGKLRIPDFMIKHLQEASLETAMPAKSLQREPVAASKVLGCSPYGAPMPDQIADRPNLKNPEPLRSELLQKGAPMPTRSKQGVPMPARSTQGAPVPARPTQEAPVLARSKQEVITSSLVFSDTSEEVLNLGFSDATLKTTEQQRKRRLKKKQGAPVPIGSQQSGDQLEISVHLSDDLKKTSFETPIPNKPLRAPLAPMPKILDGPKRKIPEPPRKELLQQKPLAPYLKIEPVCCTTVIDTISEWRHVTNPELRSKELLRQRLQNAPALVPASSLRIPRPVREKWREMLEQEQTQQNNPKGVSVPTKRTVVPPCSPQQPPGSLQGAPMPSWSTEALAPRQKLCVETDNYQAPQITTSKLNQRTLSSLQPRTRLTQKRALDKAGVDQSPPPKKQRMAIEVKDQQSDQGSIDQIVCLCNIFSKCCVISNL